MSSSKLFVGYVSLEAWAEVADSTRPIYATKVAEADSSNSSGPVVCKLSVMVAQPDEQGIVHYCRIPVANMTALDGQPFGAEAELRLRCHADVWRMVQDWLRERDFTIRQAAVALPSDLRLFLGRAGFLHFDLDTQRYARKDLTTSPTTTLFPERRR